MQAILERDRSVAAGGRLPLPPADAARGTEPRLDPEELDQLRKLMAQFEQAHADFLRLCRDRPDDAVNPLKVSFANQLIGQANLLLERCEKPFADFDAFLDNLALSNSDLLLVLGQYKCCLQKFGDDHAREAGYTLCWVSGVTLVGRENGLASPFG